MLNKLPLFEEVSAKISTVLAQSPMRDVEKNLRALLTAAFSHLDLVNQEEFAIQQALLIHTREKVTELERRLAELEGRLPPTP